MTSILFLPVRWLIADTTPYSDPDIFPLLPGQMFLSLKAPEWSTSVKRSVSGRERRNARWSEPIWSFQVAYEMIRNRPSSKDLERLYAFFNLRSGQFLPFYYYDPTDCQVENQFLGVGDGVATSYPLIRSFSYATARWDQGVFTTFSLPPPTFMVNGIAAVATIENNNRVVFEVPPPVGATVTWSGYFMFKCRFNQDRIEPAQMVSDLWDLTAGIEFVSIKS